MEEYTWDNIIINPTLEEARNCIGKEVYYDDSPTSCLYCANNDTDYYMILKEIEPDKSYPFILENNLPCACIILKKGKKPEYVPFSNKEEFLSAYEEHTNNMKKYGLWIYQKIGYFDENVPRLITEMWGDGVIVGSDSHTIKWKDLLERFVFENNEPCGKLQEGK